VIRPQCSLAPLDPSADITGIKEMSEKEKKAAEGQGAGTS